MLEAYKNNSKAILESSSIKTNWGKWVYNFFPKF